jgi:GNAT superfamily N-acetyltransferase
MSQTIRPATLHDLDPLVPLFDAYRQFYGQQSDLVIARQFLSDRLSRNESVVLIAEDQAGGAILAAPVYVLSDLFVMPEARRRGAGTLLLRSAAETARTAGAVRLELATAITNARPDGSMKP